MEKVLSGIEPELLWKYFDELRKIPRCSKHEEKAAEYVASAVRNLGFESESDDAGNVIAKKPATEGCENAPIVVLQAHLDMVCEKNKDSDHDFAKDPIEIEIEGDYLHAKGTTLGADNGIGVSAALAILEDENAVHGPLELVFTIDEEEGMSGAYGIQEGALKGRRMINLDTDQIHALYVGCAGGENSEVRLPVRWEETEGSAEGSSNGAAALMVSLKGLKGGHSGVEIHLERGNAIKLLGRSLWEAKENVPFRLASIKGGEKHNAIPREAEAIVILQEVDVDAFRTRIEKSEKALQKEYESVDPKLEIEVSGVRLPDKAIGTDNSEKVLNLIEALPSGVMRWSPDIEDLVESSVNLSVLRIEGDEIFFLVSARSSSETQLASLTDRINAIFRLVGAKVVHGDAYPAWHPNLNSKMLRVCKEAHEELFGRKPEVTAIHAGLEAGIIKKTVSGMDIVAVGALIENAHSPDERVSITSVQELYKLVLRSLEKVAEMRAE